MKIVYSLFFISTLAFAVTAGKVWRVPTGGTLPKWGAVDLNNTTSVGAQKPVVSNTSASANLAVVRFYRSSSSSASNCDPGNIVGEGYSSCTRNSAGNYSATFSTAFADTPTCVCTGNAGFHCSLSPSTTSVNFVIDGAVDKPFNMICIGQRT